jgi:hypothetical protein
MCRGSGAWQEARPGRYPQLRIPQLRIDGTERGLCLGHIQQWTSASVGMRGRPPSRQLALVSPILVPRRPCSCAVGAVPVVHSRRCVGMSNGSFVHHTVFRLTAHPARCQEKPRADRVCHQRGLTTHPSRLEAGSHSRGRCTTESSQASGSKLNWKLDLLFIGSLLIRSGMPMGNEQVGAECRGYFAGVRWWSNSCASARSRPPQRSN